ncbi:MAG: hypothetical protein SPL43_07630 [Prevotella sp.]|nr:hypothetical protein [Prevotella sp.]
MIYFLCVAGFFLLCPVIIIVDYIFSDYRPNEAQMKAMKEEYERKKEEKKLKSSNRVRIERIMGTKSYRTVR